MENSTREDVDPGQATSPTRPEAYPTERRTRLSGAWTALIVGIVTLVLILIFILQNQQNVAVSFLMFRGHLPLAVALLFGMVLGAVIVVAFGGARILQLRLARRRAVQGAPSASSTVE